LQAFFLDRFRYLAGHATEIWHVLNKLISKFPAHHGSAYVSD
jgi:hypothetical protein